MTKTRSPYRFRGPETWAAVREAYMAGETGAAVAARFGVTDGAIRQRAFREGWTRKALATAAEAPVKRRATLAEGRALRDPTDAHARTPSAAPEAREADDLSPDLVSSDPHALLDLALRRAAAAMRQGRGEEALRMTDLGERLLGLAHEARRLRPFTLEQAEAASSALRERLEAAACDAAKAALTDPETAPAPMREWARKWRAEHLGKLGEVSSG